MFDVFKNEITISSIIKLYLTTGKELEGEVLDIGDNNVLIKAKDDSQNRIFDKIIGGWEVIASVTKLDKVLTQDKEIAVDEIGVVEDKVSIEKPQGEVKDLNHSPNSSQQSTESDKKIYSKEGYLIEFKGKYKSLEDLREKKNEVEKSKLIPANGIIIKHSEERGFGFLRNEKKEELFFGYRDIIDDELKEKLKGEKQNINIHVVFSNSSNYKGNKATCIHIPWTVSKSLELLNKLFNNKEYNNASLICNQILYSFPTNLNAEKILEEINKRKKKRSNVSKGFEPFYLVGKKAKDIKNYEEAIKNLKLSIENEERLDSAVKDLASCYQEIGQMDAGIQVLEKYLDKLQNSTTTYNFVANYYSAWGNYDAAITFFNKLLELTPLAKQLEILSRKTYCLIQLRNFDAAIKEIDKILSINNAHPFAEKWKEKINEYREIGNDAQLTIADEIDLLNNLTGVTKIISNDLELCKYEGVPEDALIKSEFNKKDLELLRQRFIQLINEKGKSIPSERAKWLLTEIKLVKEYQLDDEDKLNALISRYCIAKAQSFAINNSFDLMRTYYLELFKINKDMNFIIQPLLLCLLTYSVKWDWIKESQYIKGIGNREVNIFKNNGLKNVLKINIDSGKSFDIIMEFLLEVSVYNSVLSLHIISVLINNENFKKKIINYLGLNLISEKEIIEEWKICVRNVEKKRRLFDLKCKQVSSDINLEITILNLNNFLIEIKSFAKTNIDSIRYQEFIDIFSEAQKYLTTTSFEDKERTFSMLKSLVNNFEEEISLKPTGFSIENLHPIVKNILKCISKSFSKILESSKPKITLSILGDSRFVDLNNKVIVQLSIKNEKGCSPIHDLKINIEENNNFKLLDPLKISSESLKGGDERIVQIPLKASDDILKQEATTMIVSLEYHSREKEEINLLANQQLAIRFYSSADFELIDNPYSAIADSGPVKDEKMFFGRENIIEEITKSLILSSSQKFIDIYGQKRSGKSSLLYHLTQNLKKSTKFICINFSLGSSTVYDSSSFFYLILEGIERFIENHSNFEDPKPNFQAPKIKDLMLNPSIVFYENIKELQKEMNKCDNWKDRKLLLLIDEFTYLYSASLRNTLEPEFMKTWKAMLERGLFSAIVVGQDIMPKFKAKFPNEFGVFEDRRLTYLNKEDAQKLIEEPIWNYKTNKSRFIGNAVNKILDYTSLNPYYIQIFCARLVDFMNEKKLTSVTEADIIDVAKSFIEGLSALPIDKFDNLLNAGDADLEAVSQEEILEILRQIANNSRILGSCPRDSISLKDRDYDDQILEDLLKRDILTCPNSNYYRIQVQIFNDWLLKH